MSHHASNQNGSWVGAAVARYEDRLVRYAAQITGDLERARDVVQDTFLRLCDQQQAELEDRLAPWLFTVARRRAIDVRRKEKRMPTITNEKVVEPTSRETSQADAAEQRDTTQQVEHCVAELSENQQEVLRLKFQGALSYREIAEVTGLTVSNVGYLLHTAIQKIRAKLET